MHKWSVGFFALIFLCQSPTAFANVPSATIEAKPENKIVSSGRKFPDIIFALPDAEKAKMDIPADLYGDFWKKWHFVGARWRQDIHEFRLTYANDLAWKTMLEGRTDYPKGAMFGKLAYPAEEDLALPSSVMPANLINRLMIMLWDPTHKKVSSDGWVYVRFVNPDPRSPKDPASTGIWGVMSEKEIKACVECHARAADRGYVFSQPQFLFTDDQAPKEKTTDKTLLASRYSESVKEISAQTIPKIANNLIESFPDWKNRKIMGYMGDFFTGALGQMRPVLEKMALKDPTSLFIIYDRQDPNTFEISSSINMVNRNNCIATVRLRGAGLTEIRENSNSKNKKANNGDEAYPKAETDTAVVGPQGVRIQDLSKEYKPSATVFITCGVDKMRQRLPLLYTVKDKDGFPSYYFAPAVLDDKALPAKQ